MVDMTSAGQEPADDQHTNDADRTAFGMTPPPAPPEDDEPQDAAEPEPALEVDAEAPAPSRIPSVITTTTLFFLAPDLPPMPERPVRRDEPDEEQDEPRERRGRRSRSRDRDRDARSDRQGGDRDDRDELDARDDRDDRDAQDGDAGDDQSSSSRSRRRGRRTRGQDEEQRPAELITEPQKIKGSTRLEAKRQRRRESRDTGRRRQVITESEFLARREAVDRQMLVRAKDGRVQIGVMEDKVLVEHYVARAEESSLIGNVYLGRVQNVLPSMEAAFIDIGRGRNAVLYSGEVDWAAAELGANQARRIENALKPGDRVLVQVTKDPVGHKGARLTSQVSLPGRYLVYVPGNSMNGISRKLPDTERARLKKILKEVLPPGVGVIVRTAAEGATKEQLERDVNRLMAQWEAISKKVAEGRAPQMLHSEPDLLIKIIRDVFNEDFGKIVIQGEPELETIAEYLGAVAPDLVDRIERFEGADVFTAYRADEQIEKALDRKVWLPSGGSLVIDRTEAMTVVDVNTGKFVGSGGNLEETVTKNNLEAAEEVVRQLRLRDIGGIIVVDFIDMVLESNRDLVLRRLVECLSRDRTRHQVAEVTSLGLVQMTRKKLGLGLLETFSEACECCAGRGVVVQHEPVAKKQGEAQQDGGRGRRGRKGSGNGGGNGSGNGGGQQAEAPKAQTHQVTADARNALSKIAASTIANGHAGEKPADATEAPAGESSERAAKADGSAQGGQPAADREQGAQGGQPDDQQGEGGGSRRRSRRGRRSRGGDRAQEARTEGEQPEQTPEARQQDAPVSDDPAAALAADLAALAPSTAGERAERPDAVADEAPDLSLLVRVLDELADEDGEAPEAAPAEAASAEAGAEPALAAAPTSEPEPATEPAPAPAAEPTSGSRRRGGRRRITTDTISTE